MLRTVTEQELLLLLGKKKKCPMCYLLVLHIFFWPMKIFGA